METPFALGPLAIQTMPEAYVAMLLGAAIPWTSALRAMRACTVTFVDMQRPYPHGTPHSTLQKAEPGLQTTALTDTDHDGIPGAWGKASTCKTPPTASCGGGNGYTIPESYLIQLGGNGRGVAEKAEHKRTVVLHLTSAQSKYDYWQIEA